MTHAHPVKYLVSVSRHGHVMHRQQADSQIEAAALASRFGEAPDTDVEVTEIHDIAETDLTTRTRELLEHMREANVDA